MIYRNFPRFFFFFIFLRFFYSFLMFSYFLYKTKKKNSWLYLWFLYYSGVDLTWLFFFLLFYFKRNIKEKNNKNKTKLTHFRWRQMNTLDFFFFYFFDSCFFLNNNFLNDFVFFLFLWDVPSQLSSWLRFKDKKMNHSIIFVCCVCDLSWIEIFFFCLFFL